VNSNIVRTCTRSFVVFKVHTSRDDVELDHRSKKADLCLGVFSHGTDAQLQQRTEENVQKQGDRFVPGCAKNCVTVNCSSGFFFSEHWSIFLAKMIPKREIGKICHTVVNLGSFGNLVSDE
jgi:hypothetical protein